MGLKIGHLCEPNPVMNSSKNSLICENAVTGSLHNPVYESNFTGVSIVMPYDSSV